MEYPFKKKPACDSLGNTPRPPHKTPQNTAASLTTGSPFIFPQTLDIIISLGPIFLFYANAAVIYFCKPSFTPTEIKKRKQGLERVGEVKSCRSIIYQFPNLQHAPQTRHGALHSPPPLPPLFTLKIIYISFLNRPHFVQVKLHVFFPSAFGSSGT